jgi:hypothetical protein
MRASFEVILKTDKAVVICDLDQGMSVTNDAEAVVAHLLKHGIVKPGMRLHYYDTEGQLDELLFSENGFTGFSSARPDADVLLALN